MKKISIDLPEDAVRNPEGYFADIKNACRAALKDQHKYRVYIHPEDNGEIGGWITYFDLSYEQVKQYAENHWTPDNRAGAELKAACREIVEGVDDE